MKDARGGTRRVTQISPLAGVTAGTAAVLFAFGVLALAWHRVAAQVSMAIAVLAYAVMAAVAVIAVAVAVYAFLWVRHRARNPELLAGRQAVRAEVLPAQPPGAASQLLAWRPAAAIDPPRASPAGAYAAIPGHAEGTITEGK